MAADLYLDRARESGRGTTVRHAMRQLLLLIVVLLVSPGGWRDEHRASSEAGRGGPAWVLAVAAQDAPPLPPVSRLGILMNVISSDPDANLLPSMRMSSALNATLLSPTEVKAQLEVLQIIEIDELRKSFKADIILTIAWYDPLLDVPEAFVFLEQDASIDLRELCVDDMCLRFPFFTPDLQFLNVYEAVHPSMPVSLMSLSRNGQLKHSIKMSGWFTLHAMDLQMFPQDKQWLHMDIESVSYPRSMLKIVSSNPAISYHPSVFSTVQNAWQVIENTSALSTMKSWDPSPSIVTSDPLAVHEVISFHFRVMRRSRIRYFRDVLPVYVVLILIGSTFLLKLEMALDRFNIVLTLLLSLSALMYVTTSGMPQLDTLSRMDIFLIWSFVGTMTAAVVHLVIIYLRLKQVLIARLLNACFFICFIYAATVLVIFCFVQNQRDFRIAISVVSAAFGISLIPTARYIYWRFKRDNEKLGKSDPFDVIFNRRKGTTDERDGGMPHDQMAAAAANAQMHGGLTMNHLFNEDPKDVGELIRSPSYHGTELRGLASSDGKTRRETSSDDHNQGRRSEEVGGNGGSPGLTGAPSEGTMMHSRALRSGALRAYSRPGGMTSHVRV